MDHYYFEMTSHFDWNFWNADFWHKLVGWIFELWLSICAHFIRILRYLKHIVLEMVGSWIPTHLLCKCVFFIARFSVKFLIWLKFKNSRRRFSGAEKKILTLFDMGYNAVEKDLTSSRDLGARSASAFYVVLAVFSISCRHRVSNVFQQCSGF